VRIALGETELAPVTRPTVLMRSMASSMSPALSRAEVPCRALCIALGFIGWKLHAFLAAGGQVLNEDGEEAGVESIFGPLLVDRVSRKA
jgi:hypothetical protein